MLFNSYIFILFFLPLCVAGFFLLNKVGVLPANLFLFGMSLWFYGYFHPAYLLIICASILLNYAAYLLIQRSPDKVRKKAVMITAVILNLGILGWFKYMDFFIGNVNAIFRTDLPLLHIALPLGISFFTFQQLSFVIDSYHGEVGDYDFLTYACYVAFFPQLVAGPIVSHSEFIPQFVKSETRRVNWDNLSRGIYHFSLGLGKKVLIADRFGAAVDGCYNVTASLSTPSALFTILGYTLQIYFDFSGYCDMAIGIGDMFNIELPINFNSPYKSRDVVDFWKRWHMTLTRFFTKYVYIPLGGNRKGAVRTYRNVMIVFILSGLWHGASWTFVFWGTCYGILLVLNRMCKKQLDKIPAFLMVPVTFIIVNILWVFFRSPDFTTAFELFGSVLHGGYAPLPAYITEAFNLPEFNFILRGAYSNIFPLIMTVLYLVLALFLVFVPKNNCQRLAPDSKIRVPQALISGVLLAWCVLSFADVSSFLYFNF
jgi:alginate O-acetyltransferase complex protein AlgI